MQTTGFFIGVYLLNQNIFIVFFVFKVNTDVLKHVAYINSEYYLPNNNFSIPTGMN